MNRREFLKSVIGAMAATMVPSWPALGEGELARGELGQWHGIKINPDTWNHVCLVCRSVTERELWINGDRVAQSAAPLRMEVEGFGDDDYPMTLECWAKAGKGRPEISNVSLFAMSAQPAPFGSITLGVDRT